MFENTMSGIPEKAPRPTMEGSLARLPLPNLLQSLAAGEPCQILLVTGHAPEGFIWLSGKRVVRCQKRDGSTGSAAFYGLSMDHSIKGFRVYPLPEDRIPEPEEENVGDLDPLLLNAVYLHDSKCAGPFEEAKAHVELGLPIPSRASRFDEAKAHLALGKPVPEHCGHLEEVKARLALGKPVPGQVGRDTIVKAYRALGLEVPFVNQSA